MLRNVSGLLLFFHLLSSLWLSGCVGTIKDNSSDLKESINNKRYDIIFDGISSVEAIAHSKVYVSFKPALGGSGNYSYKIYLDGNRISPVTAVSVEPNDIDSLGFYHATVENLAIGSVHTVLVRAYDKTYNVEDSNNRELSVTTLNYEVPLFDGVVAVENLPGLAGESQLLVKWNIARAASETGDVFSSNPQAVSGYNVYVGQSEETLTYYTTVNNPSTSELLLSNLITGTNYYVKVRARNSATPNQEELNREVAQGKTTTTSPIIFGGASTLEVSKSAAGLSSFKINWAAGSGSYDRYRIFVTKTLKTSFDPAVDTPYTSDLTNLGLSSFTMSTAEPHTPYYAAVVACNNPACTIYQGHDKVKSIKTTPPIAPFNGIKEIRQPSGTSGLNSVDITWDLPDTTLGIYDQIRIFRSDSSGNYNPLTDQVGQYSHAVGTLGYNLLLTTSTGTRIEGMSLATEYCFVAEAYSTTPIDPANLNGRSSNSKKPRCLTPQYIYPSFLGVNSNCTNITGSSLKISWATPSPVGIYSKYEIYVYQAQAGFSFTNAISGVTGYSKLAAATTVNNYVVTDLAPATTYQIGVKTFFEDAGLNKFYDFNQVVATCSTSSGKVIHNGWQEIMAIGPKIDGLTGLAKTEKVAAPGDANFVIRVPVEDATAIPGISGSNKGIVRLVWTDFELTDSLGKMYDFRTAANSGYRVYRKPWVIGHSSLRPTIGDSDWGTPIHSGYIIPTKYYDTVSGEDNFYGELNDYTVTQHAQPDTVNVYWYKVEAFINGVKIQYDTQPTDAVIKVILPTNNVALMHRWMINQQVCTSLQRPPDRNNNYRCAFNGIGSTNDYYDYGGHYLMDRFELGCNFTRGNVTASKCSEPSVGANTRWLGRDTSATYGVQAGDCIGGVQSTEVTEAGSNPGTGTTLSGLIGNRYQTVAYWRNRSSTSCFLNTSGTVDGTPGTTWATINNVEPVATIPQLSILPALVSGVYPNGKGLGKVIATNNANMPPIDGISQQTAYKICRGNSVKFNGQTYPKRTPTQEEYFQALDMTVLVTKDTNKKIQAGTQEITSPDRDCKQGTYASPNGPSFIDFKENRYHSANVGGYTTFLTTGSSGTNSSELCVSKYGIQDLYGSAPEWIADQLSCLNGFGCNAGFTDLNNSPPTTAFNPLSSTESKARLRNGDSAYLNMATINSSSVDSFMPAIDDTIYYFDNYLNSAGLGPAIYENSTYVSPVNGLPLSCTGAACSSGTDDNLLLTGQGSNWFNGNTNLVIGYQHRSQDLFNRRFGSYNNLRATTGVIGQLLDGGYDTGNTGGITLFRYYLSNSTSKTNGSARCGVKLHENTSEVIQNPVYD